MISTKRGYFGIGVYHVKSRVNIGTLWRSANIFGASFIFTIGKRYKKQSSDTLKTYRHIPLYHYTTFDDMVKNQPYSCPVIAIEQSESSIDLRAFKHPERGIYLLGAEDHGIPAGILSRCQQTVHINTDRCLNVAVAGSIIMYDRRSR